jgi:Big-like domain-containing protein
MNRACLIVAVLVTVSCEGDRRSPLASRLPTSPTSPTSPAVFLVTFTIPGPAPTIGPGESSQVKAVLRYSDGSEKDVTAEATWTSTQTRIATVTAGVITGQALGRVTIRAAYESRTSSLPMVIQPAGTYILNGTITEPGPINVQMATVEVVGAPNQVTANTSGSYELFGVSGTVSVRASKPGYFDETRALTVTQNQKLDLQIRPVSAPISLAGTYRVTLTVSSSCAVVPEEYRTRTYTGAIEQNAARLQMQLHDANFVKDRQGVEQNRIDGGVAGGTVTFEWGIDDYYYYYYDNPGVQEILSGGQILGIWGRMEAQAARTMSGTLVGGFTFREGNRTRTCSASNNTVVLTRN